MKDLYYKKYKTYKRTYLESIKYVGTYLPKDGMSHILSYQPRYNMEESYRLKWNNPNGFRIIDFIKFLVKHKTNIHQHYDSQIRLISKY